jgi:beta-glucosidase
VRATRIVEAADSDQTFADLTHARIRYHSSRPDLASVNRAGMVTVHATGVTTISVTVNGIADWWANSPVPGGDIVTTLPYLNIGGGRMDQTVSLYYTSVASQPGKTVRCLQLPDVNDGVLPGNVMHVFALSIG